MSWFSGKLVKSIIVIIINVETTVLFNIFLWKPEFKNSSDWIHQYYITLYNIINQHTSVLLHIVWMQNFFWVQSWLLYECLYFHWWHRISLVHSYAITEHVSWLAQYENRSVNVSPTELSIITEQSFSEKQKDRDVSGNITDVFVLLAFISSMYTGDIWNWFIVFLYRVHSAF